MGTEEEQIEYAMRMSMQESDTTEGAAKEEKMDVDDTPAKTGSKSTDEGGEEDYSEVMNDPEFLQEDDSSNAVVSNGSGGFQLDFDPNDDPELALVLRLSMEENRARLAQDEKTENDANELQPNMRSEDSSN